MAVRDFAAVDVAPVLGRYIVESRSFAVPALRVGVARGIKRDDFSQVGHGCVVEKSLAHRHIAQRRHLERTAEFSLIRFTGQLFGVAQAQVVAAVT